MVPVPAAIVFLYNFIHITHEEKTVKYTYIYIYTLNSYINYIFLRIFKTSLKIFDTIFTYMQSACEVQHNTVLLVVSLFLEILS